MTKKYTIKIDQGLHLRFKIAAIHAGRTLSELVTDAMEAYEKSNLPKAKSPASNKHTDKTQSKTTHSHKRTEQSVIYSVSPDETPINLKGKYVRSFYKIGTYKLNDTPYARNINKVAGIIETMLIKAGPKGVMAKDLHPNLESKGFKSGIRRDALSYLGHNLKIENKRSRWLHVTHLTATARGATRKRA